MAGLTASPLIRLALSFAGTFCRRRLIHNWKVNNDLELNVSPTEDTLAIYCHMLQDAVSCMGCLPPATSKRCIDGCQK